MGGLPIAEGPVLPPNGWVRLRTAAEVLELRGDADGAAALRAEAEALLPLIRDLYVPGAGHFMTRCPNGSLHETRHCYDFATLGTTIAEDLDEGTRREMVDFFVRELRTPSWMRALSASDDDAGYSLRPDHQWNGPIADLDPDARLTGVRVAGGVVDVSSDGTVSSG